MGLNPYQNSVPDFTCFVRLNQADTMQRSLFWSLSSAIVACGSLIAMDVLVMRHVPADPMRTTDYFPVAEVVLSIGIGAIAATNAVLLSIPVFLTRRMLPLIWLIPMLAFGFWFLDFYDWRGLFNLGKPQHVVWELMLEALPLLFRFHLPTFLLAELGVFLSVAQLIRYAETRQAESRQHEFDAILYDLSLNSDEK